MLSPDGQYFFTLYRSYVGTGYEHSIAKYTTAGVKVWETNKAGNLMSRDIATNGDIVVCLWIDGRLQMLSASNGALIRTVTLGYTGYNNVLSDSALGMFVSLERNGRMAFVTNDGTIHKLTIPSAESVIERAVTSWAFAITGI